MSLRLLVVEGNVRAEREAYGHATGESYAGVLGEVAPDAVCDICYPTDTGANPASPDAYDGVFITGSALNLYDGGPEIAAQIELARAVFAAGTPMFGSCWGLQVAAAASGGAVMRNPLGREIGIARNIALTAEGRAHPLLAGRPAAFDALCTHLDIVALPEGARALAENGMSPVQAAEIRFGEGLFWGVQYHPEFSLADVAAIIARRKARLTEEGLFASEPQADSYVADLRLLDSEPTRRDLGWRLGIDAEVTDAGRRRVELHNFVERLVRPSKSRRGRA